MKKYLSMIIFALALQGCSATVGEWQQGTKASGYRAHMCASFVANRSSLFPTNHTVGQNLLKKQTTTTIQTQ